MLVSRPSDSSSLFARETAFPLEKRSHSEGSKDGGHDIGGDATQGGNRETTPLPSDVLDPGPSILAVAFVSATVNTETTHTTAAFAYVARSSTAAGGGGGIPALRFLDVQNATTCQSYAFSWTYLGPNPSSTLTLLVNQGKPWSSNNETTKHSSRFVGGAPTIRILSSNISSNATNFVWDSVNLNEGWYMLDAHLTKNNRGNKFSSQPASFYVVNGTDTSCVRFYKPITPSRPHLGTGDIAGVIVGAVAAAVLLAVAFAFPRLWRRDLPSPKRPRPYYLY